MRGLSLSTIVNKLLFVCVCPAGVRVPEDLKRQSRNLFVEMLTEAKVYSTGVTEEDDEKIQAWIKIA